MLTYRIRKRIFRHEPGSAIQLPAECVLRFHFLPKQPFGAEAGNGRTAILAKAARVFFNANSGHHTIESAEPLAPLDVTIDEGRRVIRCVGNVLEISSEYSSLEACEEEIQGLYFVLPMLLNVDFADPPIVERVDGAIGGVAFCWELSDWRMLYDITTQDRQEQRLITAWERLPSIAPLENRRILAALHYFHVAVRLNRVGTAPGEFLAEVVLNFSKVLEVLFPPHGGGQTRNAARDGLRKLGFDNDTIEAEFIPAMALRNEIDVGHVDLAIFTREQLTDIHAFCERAESSFRQLLSRVLQGMQSGEWKPPAHEQQQLDRSTLTVLERLATSNMDGSVDSAT